MSPQFSPPWRPFTALLALLLVLSTHAFVPHHPRTISTASTAVFSRPHHPALSSPYHRTHSSLSATPEEASEEEEEWHPIDMAFTTPQLLSAIWFMIAQGSSMAKGESMTVRFPKMEEKFSPSYLSRLMGHLDSCKDVCDFFGTKTVLVPYAPEGKITGFTVKSYRDPSKDENEEFDYDPFWDDGTEWDYEGIDEEIDGKDTTNQYPEIVNRIPDDDEVIIQTTKRWVDKMMSDMGICPFTQGPNLAGLPMGPVFYCVDRCTQMEDMYARYWKEVVRVEQNPEKDISTTLLIAPEFLIDNIELFESFSNTLTQPLTALGVEDLLQLVFFHPQWTFRDGGERSGMGAAANYARRSPWPMINILRTKQVRAAQRGIPTGLVYQQNEKTLNAVGTEKLETMLRLRDWSEISDIKVNRKDMEALRVARDFQETGSLKAEDTTFAYDSTPAANKVDRSQIEGGDLVNVLKQALEKRLGKGEDGTVTRLSGPETSATVMASDFLLEELTRLGQSNVKELSEAERMILEDFEQPDMRNDDEMDALFGGGISMTNDDDESTGVDPRTFY